MENILLTTFVNNLLEKCENVDTEIIYQLIKDETMFSGNYDDMVEQIIEFGILPNVIEDYSELDERYFIVEENIINTPYGIKATKNILVTPLGQIKIVELFRREYENNKYN